MDRASSAHHERGVRGDAPRWWALLAVLCAVAVVLAGAAPAAALASEDGDAADRTAAERDDETADDGSDGDAADDTDDGRRVSVVGRRYRIDHGPCDLDERPDGASEHWTPRGKSLIHTIAHGEGLRDVAAAYGFAGKDGYRKLFDANPQLDVLWLGRSGETLRVPTCGTRLVRRPLPPPPPPEPEPEPEPAPPAEEEAPAPEPEPEPQPEPAPPVAGDSVWDRLAQCESGGNWSINTGNGYYGGLQFALPTWQSVGGTGYPHEHSREEQIKRGKILQARAGWGQWPACAAKLGLL